MDESKANRRLAGDADASTRGGRARAGLFALLAALLVLATEQVIEHFARQSVIEHERSGVLHELSALRARLEGAVNANLFLIHGLTAVIAAHPEMDQAGFASIARNLVDERHVLRNIAAAPDMVISLMYPPEGNEAAMGLDYRTRPDQSAAALRARDSGQAVLAGPLTLAQGGVAFVAREPVFLDAAGSGAERPFWGLVSAVMDAETLYRKAGLRDPDLGLRLAVRGTDGTGPQGPVFFGDAQLFSERPVTLAVTLPGGTWQMAAIPTGGWGLHRSNIDWIRLMGLLAALTAGLMAYRLTRGNQALAGYGARLRTLFDTIPDLVWLKDAKGVYRACNPRFEQLVGAAEADIQGRTDEDLVPPDLVGFLRERDREAVAAGAARVGEEWVRFAGDGHRELLETITTPVFDHRGGLLGVLGIARDITARRLTEAALIESETRQRIFIEHAPAALAMFDRQMRYLAVSRRWLTDYRLHDGEILGRSHYEVFADIPERWKEVHRRALAGEVVKSDEDRFERQDGTAQWLRWEARPWYAADGSVGGIVVFTEDITERKQAEASARQSELVLDSVFQALPDLFFLMAPDGRILDYRARTRADLYVPPETFIGKRMQDVLPAPVAEQFERNLAAILRQGEMATSEYDLELPQGVRHYEARLSRLPQGDRIVAVVRDLTERVQAQEALEAQRREAAFLADLLERSSQPVAVGFPDGSMGRCNQAFLDLVGYTREEMVRIDWNKDLTPARWFAVEKQALEQLDRDHRPVRYEKEYLRKDGSSVPIELHVDIVARAGGGAEYYFAFVTDITERKRDEARLREQAASLRELSERLMRAQEDERRSLAQELHDEIGQQLAALKLNLQTLARTLPGQAVAHRLADCVEITDTAIEQVRDRAFNLRPSMLDDIGLAAALEWYCRRQSERSGTQITLTVEAFEREPVDPLQITLYRIVQEAVNNAIRYAQAQHIGVALQVGDGSVEILISDDGRGFDSAALDPRRDDSLGLLGMRERVTWLGGAIDIASAPGEGTRLRVVLPMTGGPA